MGLTLGSFLCYIVAREYPEQTFLSKVITDSRVCGQRHILYGNESDPSQFAPYNIFDSDSDRCPRRLNRQKV
jgi:hypothetical protein